MRNVKIIKFMSKIFNLNKMNYEVGPFKTSGNYNHVINRHVKYNKMDLHIRKILYD
jgi:hypothetical protein